jgi:hypothetical protein
VPAPAYAASSASFTAAPSIALRIFAVTAGEGTPRRPSDSGAGGCTRAPECDRARAVPEELHLDVPRGVDELLDEDAPSPNAASASRCALSNASDSSSALDDAPHSSSAAPSGRLEKDRIADSIRLRERRLRVGDLLRPGTTGIPSRIAVRRADDLSPSCSMLSGEGPRKRMPASRHARAKRGALRQEAVAGWIASAPCGAAASSTRSARR